MPETAEQTLLQIYREEVRAEAKKQMARNDEYILEGKFWNVKQLADWIGMGKDWVRDHLYANPQYAAEFERLERQGVFIPGTRGRSYRFKAKEMATWLEQHWREFKW